MRFPPQMGGVRKYTHSPATGTNPTVSVTPTSTDDTPVIDTIFAVPASSTNLNATLAVTSSDSTTVWSAGVGTRPETFKFPKGLYLGNNLAMTVTLTLGSTLDQGILSVLGR